MDRSRTVISRVFLFMLLLLLLLLLGLWYFNVQCLTSTNIYNKVADSSVLGLTSFTTIPNTSEVNGGETAQFVVKNDLNNLLSGGVLILSLDGNGKIVDPIVGPGVCTVTSDTEAICTDLNLNPNQENEWTVNVLADRNCLADADITLNSVLNSLLDVQLGSQAASIACNPVDETTVPTAEETPDDDTDTTTTTTNTNTTTTVTSETELLDDDSDITFTSTEGKLIKRVLDRHNMQIEKCMTNNTIFLGGAALLILILFWVFVLTYMLGDRDTKVVQVIR